MRRAAEHDDLEVPQADQPRRTRISPAPASSRRVRSAISDATAHVVAEAVVGATEHLHVADGVGGVNRDVEVVGHDHLDAAEVHPGVDEAGLRRPAEVSRVEFGEVDDVLAVVLVDDQRQLVGRARAIGHLRAVEVQVDLARFDGYEEGPDRRAGESPAE